MRVGVLEQRLCTIHNKIALDFNSEILQVVVASKHQPVDCPFHVAFL